MARAVYSLPEGWARLDVEVWVGASDIRFCCRGDETFRPRQRPGQRRIEYRDYLKELSRKPQAVRQVAPELEAELRTRQDNAARRYLRLAQFPDQNSLEQIEWEALQGVSRPKLPELARCRCVETAEDVLTTRGKSYSTGRGKLMTKNGENR